MDLEIPLWSSQLRLDKTGSGGVVTMLKSLNYFASYVVQFYFIWLADPVCTASEMNNICVLIIVLLLRTGPVKCWTEDFSYQREVSRILILYSSQLDFGPTAVAELNRSVVTAVNDVDVRLEFVDLNTSSCSHYVGNALIAVIKHMFYERTSEVMGIVGLSCSDSSYAVAQLIQRSGIPVKYIYTSFLPAPLAAEVSGTSMGLLPPLDLLAEASVALIKYANWSNVLALYQVQDIDMNHIFTHFQTLLRDKDLDSLKNYSTLNYASPLQSVETYRFSQLINRLPIRILFLMLDAKLARRALCTALNLHATYPRYQWVIVKTTMTDILMVKEAQSDSLTTCSNQELLSILQNVIFVNFQMEMNFAAINYKPECSLSTQYVYEVSIKAILASGVSTTSVSTGKSHNGSGTPTSLSDYKLPIVAAVKQVQNDEPVLHLIYSSQNSSFLVLKENGTFILSTLIRELSLIDLQIGSFLIAVNILLLVSCLILHTTMLVCRKKMSVKNSTPALLHVLYVGNYMVNVTATIYCIQKTFATSDILYIHFCRVFFFGFPTGLILIVGTIFMKTWRLYRIFIHYRDPGKFLSNCSLISFVVCLGAVNAVMCIFWFVLDPFERIYKEVDHNDFEKTGFYQTTCESKVSNWMNLILLGYSMAIQLGILVLLYRLRNKIPKHHKHLQSNSIVKFGYILLFGYFFAVPMYISARFFLHNFWLEVIVISAFMEYVQLFCIAFIFLPPLLPIFKTKIHDSSIME